MKVLIYTLNGDVHRVTPPIGGDVNSLDVLKDIPEGVEYKIMDNDLMPSHILRNAWKVSGDKVGIDLPKAKELAHGIRREKREAYMADNIVIINKSASGIPLRSDEDSSAAKDDNAKYKSDVDDVSQVSIDAAKTESEILAAIG